MNLTKHSLDILLQNQAPSGAYIAGPTFPNYQYCWFRDGAFTAYALNLAGEHGSARRFHDWAASAINRRAGVVSGALGKITRDLPLEPQDYLHTRYGLDGEEVSDQNWPNFQLDGFGSWVWAVEEHLNRSGARLPGEWGTAIRLVCEYLEALWRRPCFDCWEEFPGEIHPYTLAAIFAGLRAGTRLGVGDWNQAQESIRQEIERRATYSGYFVKYVGSYTVDGSLLGLAIPYGVIAADDPRMLETVRRIETSLVRGGGVHRYPTDTYYGGGEWVLLACWLGWYYAKTGNTERAHQLLDWTEAQADENGYLPEQVADGLNDPNYYQPWVERWGPSAKPLLWSHAKYLILRHALGPNYRDSYY